MPFQNEMIRLRTPVTALKAGCDVSTSFLPADRKSFSAPKLSAAWDLCSGLSVFLTPNHVKQTRTAAMDTRRRWAATADESVCEGESRIEFIGECLLKEEWGSLANCWSP